VEASSLKKKLRPGDLAPVTGIYMVTHEPRHREPHDAVIIRGEQLPVCRTCLTNASYEVVNAISHITHDWDFSGPQSLAIRAAARQQFGEFRVFHRYEIRLPVALSTGSAYVNLRGETSDLSAGGIGAIIEDQLPTASKTWTLTIDLGPGTEPLTSHARLRYRNGSRHGFEFVRLGAEKREMIREFIEHQMRLNAAAAS
jgi:hypothetical protein